MEHSGDVRRVLSSATIYSLFQRAVGAEGARRWLLAQLPVLGGGEKIVDVGCGPGDLVMHLRGPVEYVGIDKSREYVDRAVNRFSTRPRTTFITASATDLDGDPRLQDADVVVFHGVLHHLNDEEAARALAAARNALKPGGVVAALEPCFLLHQGAMSRWLMSRDRGADIRREQEWRDLMSLTFHRWRAQVVTRLIRIPYVHIWLEGFGPAAGPSSL